MPSWFGFSIGGQAMLLVLSLTAVHVAFTVGAYEFVGVVVRGIGFAKSSGVPQLTSADTVTATASNFHILPV